MMADGEQQIKFHELDLWNENNVKSEPVDDCCFYF